MSLPIRLLVENDCKKAFGSSAFVLQSEAEDKVVIVICSKVKLVVAVATYTAHSKETVARMLGLVSSSLLPPFFFVADSKRWHSREGEILSSPPRLSDSLSIWMR